MCVCVGGGGWPEKKGDYKQLCLGGGRGGKEGILPTLAHA